MPMSILLAAASAANGGCHQKALPLRAWSELPLPLATNVFKMSWQKSLAFAPTVIMETLTPTTSS